MDEILTALKRTELFSDVPEGMILREIMPHRQLQECRKGLFLIEPQQEMSRFGVVLAGKIHIMHFFQEGNYSLTAALTAGDLLGADLICTRTRRSPYYAMVASTARVVFFPAAMLTEPGIVQEGWRLQILSRLATWISNENMKKEYRLAILSQKGLRDRIVTYLSMQSGKLQKTAFAISFSREELAAFLCVNRSALSHELSLMEQEGLISFHKNFFTLYYLEQPESHSLRGNQPAFPF